MRRAARWWGVAVIGINRFKTSKADRADHEQSLLSEAGGSHSGDGSSNSISGEVSTGHDVPEAEAFDAVEAASQEIFDSCRKIIEYVRRTTVEQEVLLVSRRTHRRFMDPSARELIKSLPDGPLFNSYRTKSFASEKDVQEATEIYLIEIEKVKALFTNDVFHRMTSNFSKNRALRRPRRRLGNVEASRLHTFESRRFGAAPFEIQQLRADIHHCYVEDARCARDRDTIHMLFKLAEVRHPRRADIEQLLWDVTRSIDVADRGHEI